MLTRSCWDPPVPPEAQIVWHGGEGLSQYMGRSQLGVDQRRAPKVVLPEQAQTGGHAARKLAQLAALTPRACVGCGRIFTPNRRDQRHCVHNCHGQTFRGPLPKVAVGVPRPCNCGCGVVYSPTHSQQRCATATCSKRLAQATYRDKHPETHRAKEQARRERAAEKAARLDAMRQRLMQKGAAA